MKLCGPKYALCGLVLSAWGIIQLVSKAHFWAWKYLSIIQMLVLYCVVVHFLVPDGHIFLCKKRCTYRGH